MCNVARYRLNRRRIGSSSSTTLNCWERDSNGEAEGNTEVDAGTARCWFRVVVAPPEGAAGASGFAPRRSTGEVVGMSRREPRDGPLLLLFALPPDLPPAVDLLLLEAADGSTPFCLDTPREDFLFPLLSEDEPFTNFHGSLVSSLPILGG